MKQQSKLSQEQQHEATTPSQQQQQAGREFASAEELLRHDAAHTTVPPEIEERLKRTLREAGPSQRPGWLKRMFRKKG
jgi:hypothetical protein